MMPQETRLIKFDERLKIPQLGPIKIPYGVDRAGFEPATSALRMQRSYQTELSARSFSLRKTECLRFRACGGEVVITARCFTGADLVDAYIPC